MLGTAIVNPRDIDNSALRSQLQPPIKIAEMFYTKNGVPIEEDREWTGIDLFGLRKGDEANKLFIRKDYTTINLHFDREARFYADLGFDGGVWYGQGYYDNNASNMFYVACRADGAQKQVNEQFGPFTGYYWKKCVHFQNVTNGQAYTLQRYPWPIMRLTDLYLLYAEAVNEVEGPAGAHSEKMFEYLDAIRKRAGLEGIKYSWDNFAFGKKYENKEGMRQIVRRERLIELAFEGQRFWDLRRWQTAPQEYQTSIKGFRVNESDPARFYDAITLFQQKFYTRDYFWPLQTSDIERNQNLVQNPGW
jgi:hypothetical protein